MPRSTRNDVLARRAVTVHLLQDGGGRHRIAVTGNTFVPESILAAEARRARIAQTIVKTDPEKRLELGTITYLQEIAYGLFLRDKEDRMAAWLAPKTDEMLLTACGDGTGPRLDRLPLAGTATNTKTVALEILAGTDDYLLAMPFTESREEIASTARKLFPSGTRIRVRKIHHGSAGMRIPQQAGKG